MKVSAPFHSDLMRPVADRLEREFSSLTWEKPTRPIIANVDSSLLESTDEIKRALYEQTYSPVLWADGILTMEKLGVNSFLEFGPGNVLTGLAKRICKGKKAVSVSKVEDIDKDNGGNIKFPAPKYAPNRANPTINISAVDRKSVV